MITEASREHDVRLAPYGGVDIKVGDDVSLTLTWDDEAREYVIDESFRG
ncbi:hypothetical protein [Micromonospora fluostatini]